MNSVNLVGRITRDLTLRDGKVPSVKFSLAVNDGKDKDNNDIVSYPTVVAFSRQAENLCRWQGKGSQIAVQGKLQTGKYTNKDGKEVYTTEVIAHRIEFLSKNPEEFVRTKKPVEESFEPAPDQFTFDDTENVPF